MEQINLVFTNNQNNFKISLAHFRGPMWYQECPMQLDLHSVILRARAR